MLSFDSFSSTTSLRRTKRLVHPRCTGPASSYSTNAFLLDNYTRLDREYDTYAPSSMEQTLGLTYIDDDHILLPHLSGLGPQLPCPTGERKDATMFEAWIAERFEHNSDCYQQTKYDVLPALGLGPY